MVDLRYVFSLRRVENDLSAVLADHVLILSTFFHWNIIYGPNSSGCDAPTGVFLWVHSHPTLPRSRRLCTPLIPALSTNCSTNDKQAYNDVPHFVWCKCRPNGFPHNPKIIFTVLPNDANNGRIVNHCSDTPVSILHRSFSHAGKYIHITVLLDCVDCPKCFMQHPERNLSVSFI